MRVVVAAWAGSTNLGDELVLAGCLRLLREQGLTPLVLSVDPAGTRAAHGIDAVDGSDPRQVLAAVGQAGGVVFGGGGLLQDESSPWNLPYHLARVAAARLRGTPVVGLGLGAGRLGTAAGRAQVRAALRGVPTTVRDTPSADLLAGLGLARPTVASDLALLLPDVQVAPQDRVVVSLRPWDPAGRRLLPANRRARSAAPEPALRATAAALDEVAAATGLAVHLVALQADRDGPLHDAVAERMTTRATTERPDLADLPVALGSGRAVVAMRYHAGVGAVLSGRPAVMIGYSPKVDALAGELGPGARLLPWRPEGPQGLARQVEAVLGSGDAVREAAAVLRSRGERSRRVLDRLSRARGG